MKPETTPASLAERKRALIVQGAILRNDIARAGRAAQENLRPNALASGLVGQLASTTLSLLGRRGKALAGIDFATLVPLAVSGLSALSKRFLLKQSMWKPVAGGALAISVAGAVAALVARRKKMRDAVRAE